MFFKKAPIDVVQMQLLQVINHTCGSSIFEKAKWTTRKCEFGAKRPTSKLTHETIKYLVYYGMTLNTIDLEIWSTQYKKPNP